MKETEFYKAIELYGNDVLLKDPRWDKRYNYGYIVYNKQADDYVMCKGGKFFLSFKNRKEVNNYIDRKTRSAITSLEMILLGYKNAKTDKQESS